MIVCKVYFFCKFEISCKKPIANLHQTLQLQVVPGSKPMSVPAFLSKDAIYFDFLLIEMYCQMTKNTFSPPLLRFKPLTSWL